MQKLNRHALDIKSRQAIPWRTRVNRLSLPLYLHIVPFRPFQILFPNFFDVGLQIANILRESIVCMLIGRALKYKAHLLGLHPLLLWKVFVKDTGLRGDTEAVDAIIRFAFGETTESLTEKKMSECHKGGPRVEEIDFLHVFTLLKHYNRRFAWWTNTTQRMLSLTKVVILEAHLPITSNLRVPVREWLEETVESRRFSDLRCE